MESVIMKKDLGQFVLEKIIKNGLVEAQCPHCETQDKGLVLVWNAMSAELIEAAVDEYQKSCPDKDVDAYAQEVLADMLAGKSRWHIMAKHAMTPNCWSAAFSALLPKLPPEIGQRLMMNRWD